MTGEEGLELVFLGTGAAITLPAFFCTCTTCEDARKNPEYRRTRSAAALLGKEITLIDAGPDIEFQLEREGIRKVDNIFVTHWHYDHIGGLLGFGEPISISKWGIINLYGTKDVTEYIEREYGWLMKWFNLHTIKVGDMIQTGDASWKVVKTNHTQHSVGFVVNARTKFAYLVDGIVPPPETVKELTGIDLLITEGTMDFLDEEWHNFKLDDAVAFWKQTGIPECILTHVSCHGWENGELVAGMTPDERKEYVSNHPGLMIAYDGMRISLKDK